MFHIAGYVIIIGIAALQNSVYARFCDGGHQCSPPKECCAQGCCYLYAPPSAPRTTPPTSDHIFTMVFVHHWFFWFLVIAVAMAILCACSLWRKRRQLCGWGTARPHSQSGDSAGSCYAPPQYSRCSSFHHAPPPYTEVTSKPDLYPLVFSCNGHDHNKHCTGGFAASLNNQQQHCSPNSQPQHGSHQHHTQSQLYQHQHHHTHNHQSLSQQQLHNLHQADGDLAAGIESSYGGSTGVCSGGGVPFCSANGSSGGGSSYLMVQYFRNYIGRPGPVGNKNNSGSMMSGASTVDSISSSFICSANNEHNTQVPPPYSRAASPRNAVHELIDDDKDEHDGMFGRIMGDISAGSDAEMMMIMGRRSRHNNGHYNQHLHPHERHHQPHPHDQMMTGPPPVTSVSSYCLPRSTSQHHVCAMDTTITPDDAEDGESITQHNIASNRRQMVDRQTRIGSTNSEAGRTQPPHSDPLIYMNDTLCRSEGNFLRTLASTMRQDIESGRTKTSLLLPQQHQRPSSQRRRLQSVTGSQAQPPLYSSSVVSSSYNSANQIAPGPIYHSTNALYKSIVSIDDTRCSNTGATKSVKNKRPMSAVTDAQHELDRLRRSLETCCQLLEQQQHQLQQEQVEMVDGGGASAGGADGGGGGVKNVVVGVPQQPHKYHQQDQEPSPHHSSSGMMATSSSAVSSLANIGSPASPPRATSPTDEIKELLQQIRKLRKYEYDGDDTLDGCVADTVALITEGTHHHQQQRARRPSSLTNSSGASVVVSAMQQARRDFFGRNSSSSICASGAVGTSVRRYSQNAAASGIDATITAAAIGRRLRSPNSGSTQYSPLLLLGKGRKSWVSRSAPTTPGASLPPCFMDDDSPLLNEQDEEGLAGDRE